jgi:hypothetical protein
MKRFSSGLWIWSCGSRVLKHENTKKKEFTARFARDAEFAEKDFPENIGGSLKGPSQGEGPRCSASRPMWRVLGEKMSSLIFSPKTAPHKALKRSLRVLVFNSTDLMKLEVSEPSVWSVREGTIRVIRLPREICQRRPFHWGVFAQQNPCRKISRGIPAFRAGGNGLSSDLYYLCQSVWVCG